MQLKLSKTWYSLSTFFFVRSKFCLQNVALQNNSHLQTLTHIQVHLVKRQLLPTSKWYSYLNVTCLECQLASYMIKCGQIFCYLLQKSVKLPQAVKFQMAVVLKGKFSHYMCIKGNKSHTIDGKNSPQSVYF